MHLKNLLATALFLALGLLGLAWALEQGAADDLISILDPGAVVNWGLPISKMLMNVAMGVTIGSFALAAYALVPGTRAYERAAQLGTASAAAWTVTAVVAAIFTYLSIDPQNIGSSNLGQLIWFFLTEIGLGQSWLWLIAIAAVTTILASGFRGANASLFLTILALAGTLPLAISGHSTEASGHTIAVSAMLLHLGGASIWLGGLVALMVVRGALGDSVRAVTERYSTLALVSFVLVAVSGYFSAAVRIGDLSSLATGYGHIVIAKAVVITVLGAFGAYYRMRTIRRLNAGTAGRFWWLVVAELAFMGLVSGLAAGLARAQTPVPETYDEAVRTPAEILTGSPLPEPVSVRSLITDWYVDPLWLMFVAFGIFFYLAGVVRLRRRGDEWPWYRTVSWVSGMLVLLYVTCGPLNLYQQYLFSVHMTGHMILNMMIPVMLVPGAPITLAARAIRRREDGSRGAREWILWFVHSWYGQLIARPAFAVPVFALSLIIFYYTPLFRWATVDHIGHIWMIVHFLMSGYLFVQVLIGVDPGPKRPSYPIRVVILFATMAFHAFFGLTLMMGHSLLLADWFGAMGRTWGAAPLEDQQIGGGIAWGIGEIPTVLLAIFTAVSWAQDDTKVQKREDRKAKRTADAELENYNAMFERLAEQDARLDAEMAVREQGSRESGSGREPGGNDRS